MSGLTQQVGRAMAWSVFARIGRFVLGLASSVIVVRALGAHEYGVLSVVRTLLMFVVMIAGGGMGKAVLKFLPAMRVERNPGAARALVRTAVAVNLALWSVLVVAVYIGRGLIERAFPYEGLGLVLSAAVALALFELFFTLVSRVLEANYATRRLSFAALLGHVVFIAALLVVLPKGYGVLGVIVASAAGQAASCLMLAFPLGGVLQAGGSGSGSLTNISGRRVARFSAPFVAIGVLNLIVWRQSETMFLGHFRTASETGFFDLAYRLPQTLLEFVPGAVWPLVMAGISEVYARDAGEIRRAVDRYYRMLFLLCAPLCTLGVVMGGRAIPILFGESMAPAAVPTQLFFAIFTISFLGAPLSMTLYVLEKTHVSLLIYLCLAVANVGMNLLLIPRYGVPGAVISVAVVTAASPIVYRSIVRRYVSDIQIPFGYIWKCFLASGSVIVLIPFLRFLTAPIQFCVGCVVGLLLIVLAFKAVRVLSVEDVEALSAVPFPMVKRLLRFIAS